MSEQPEKTPQQRVVEEAGVDPILAGYDEVDLSRHLDPNDRMVSDIKPQTPSSEKKFALKQKKLYSVRKIYDQIEVKDMTFEQFAKAFMELSDPKRIQNDLAAIRHIKNTERTNRSRIGKALGTLS